MFQSKFLYITFVFCFRYNMFRLNHFVCNFCRIINFFFKMNIFIFKSKLHNFRS